MERTTQLEVKHQIHDQTQVLDLATRAQARLLNLKDFPIVEQNRLAQQMAVAEGWQLSPLGGFGFPDGSVLWHSGSGWQTLDPKTVNSRLQRLQKQPLELRMIYSFTGSDGREKGSTAEARFEFQLKLRKGSGTRVHQPG